MSDNKKRFIESFRRNLMLCVRNNPAQYKFGVAEIDQVVGKMEKALDNNTYFKDGEAFKLTCKELGVKLTYSEINNYWNS